MRSVPRPTRVRGVGTATGASGATGSATGDTIPLAREDPTTKFFGAINVFQSCLK